VLAAPGTSTSTSSLPLRVAGNLMIDLSASDYNPTTQLWDNRVTSGPVSTSNGDFGVINYGSVSDNPPTLTTLSNVTAVYFPYASSFYRGPSPYSLSTYSHPTGAYASLFANSIYSNNVWTLEMLVYPIEPSLTSESYENGAQRWVCSRQSWCSVFIKVSLYHTSAIVHAACNECPPPYPRTTRVTAAPSSSGVFVQRPRVPARTSA
jgi:hypothetical protein